MKRLLFNPREMSMKHMVALAKLKCNGLAIERLPITDLQPDDEIVVLYVMNGCVYDSNDPMPGMEDMPVKRYVGIAPDAHLTKRFIEAQLR